MPKRALAAPSSMQRSKFTLAPRQGGVSPFVRNGERRGVRRGLWVRVACLRSWYLEELLGRTGVLSVVVSGSVPQLKDGILGPLTSFSLLDAGQTLFTITTIVFSPGTDAEGSAALFGFDTGSSCHWIMIWESVLPK